MYLPILPSAELKQSSSDRLFVISLIMVAAFFGSFWISKRLGELGGPSGAERPGKLAWLPNAGSTSRDNQQRPV